MDLGAQRGHGPDTGFKSVAQAEENAGALAHGPLPASVMRQIDALLGRAP